MSELKKSYEPETIEDRWYSFWEEGGYFSPSGSGAAPFSIVIPPPNVTGSLHMGHALNVTIQDILSRWKRMSGCSVLWLPGTDHAGIATQNVVERELSKEHIDRYALGREAFIERVWKWKAEYGGRIIHQLKKLGASCDWTRERFTLDEGLSRAVREVFVRLFEEGLIYRDNRLINWCSRCHTALSDLEVEHEEIQGKLSYIRYPLADGHGFVTVATTRPETMLGDTAVAVHPEDERYGHYIGKLLDLPLTGRKIPVVGDSSVDPAFGTGAVKVTPAHDFNDEQVGRRHGLPAVSVIGEDGTMTAEAGERYRGLDRYACRKKVVEDLTELDLLEGERKHAHSVGHCYRCKTIIEPLVTIQWYVNVGPLAAEAIRVVEGGSIRLVPDTWDNNYFAWMRDIRDWCVSRQIWWGHQIPAWYCPECDGQGEKIEHTFFKPHILPDGAAVGGGSYAYLRALGLPHDDIIRRSKMIRIAKDVEAICRREEVRNCPSCGGPVIRDPDVLDTWFSSALWPFSTLGWPDETEDLKTFYPTSVLVTGFDILFFWVARMIMMGLKCMDDVPFRDVYIHALVRDPKGHKMSKSRGNVIDPLVIIGKYGADAFRFTLAAFAAQGRDVRFSEERVEGYRHFINKLWNASKFIVTYSELRSGQSACDSSRRLNMPSRWILSRLAVAVEEVNGHLESYRFNEAANSIYQFVWHEFCDWYIEMSKPVLYHGSEEEKSEVVDCLFFTLEKVLLMLHPFTPFVTEELWQSVFGDGTIMTKDYPRGLPRSEDAERLMHYVIEAVSAVRSIRGELNIAPSLEVAVSVRTLSDDVESALVENSEAMVRLTRCRNLRVGSDVAREKGSAVSVRDGMEVYVPLEGVLNVDAELQRLEKELTKTEESCSTIQRKLSNPDFVSGAPKEVVAKERNKFEELSKKRAKLLEHLDLLKTVS
ncbi:MAG: valine--tRNA ligase [Chloroflexota bacterium]